MAQTLDGKISTNSGHSKWIGNTENLNHAHRIRALVDSVLVGGKTIAKDLPTLNVRHVSGKNPIRLLLTSNFSDFDKLPNAPSLKTILIRNQAKPLNRSTNISKVIYYKNTKPEENIISILKQLKINGIHSILVEGGPTTLNGFLQAKVVNLLQLHIAPLIFGSGKSAFQLPEIETVSQGLHLQNMVYHQMGNAMMITGVPLIK